MLDVFFADCEKSVYNKICFFHEQHTLFVMAVVIFLALSLGIVLLYIVRRLQNPLGHIPGPPQYPIVGCLPHINLKYFHHSLTEWHKLYGPVYKACIPGFELIVVGDYEGIREVSLTSGKQFAGRVFTYRMDYLMKNTGILLSYNADSTWSQLRKASHKHLKQFGEGMSRIQNVVTEQAEDMYETFQRNAGKPFDPRQVVLDTTLNTIAFLITGIRTQPGDAIVENMRKFEKDVSVYVAGTVYPIYMMFDVIPWFRHIARSAWRNIENVVSLKTSILHEVKTLAQMHPEAESLYTVFKGHMVDTGINSDEQTGRATTSKSLLTDTDIETTIISLLFAGFTTTSTTFYATINILAHSKDVQDRIWKEISMLTESVSLDDRPNLPYTRAVLFELLRYTSVVALGVFHRSIINTEIKGIYIPENAFVLTNLWALHRDPSFWDRPDEFHPERFLDSKGELVPADHPNRKHLMPFGAGPRVCLGESLALARLFLWISTLVQRFEIFPAAGNLPSSADPRNFTYEGVVRVESYEVCFVPRKSCK